MPSDEATLARRSEVDQRQAQVAELLREWKAEQLLLLDPANVDWFAGAPLVRGILDPAEQPVVVVSETQRWVVCSNVDSQRLFDNFLDELGFQVKEWPWHQGREQLLADICQDRRIASDRNLRDAQLAGDRLKSLRLTLSPLAQDALRKLGKDLAHSLEATARNFSVGQPEQEIAGHLGHRLMHRGIEPLLVQVGGDGRFARDPRPAYTDAPVAHRCTVVAIGGRDGLQVAAARSVRFGAAQPDELHDLEKAGPIAAARVATLAPGVPDRFVFDAGQRLATTLQAEDAWRESGWGWRTGWQAVEAPLSPTGDAKLTPGQAVVVQTRIGGSLFLDTYLIGADRIECVTGPEEWSLRRYRLPDRTVDIADVFVR